MSNESARLQSGYFELSINDFSGGYVDKIDDPLLPENTAQNVQNFVGTKIGSMKKRSGQKRLNAALLPGVIQGLYPYYGNNSRQIITVAGGKGYLWDALSEAFTAIKTGIDNTAPTLFETCVNYMVAANGINPPWKWDGTTASTLDNAPADGQFPTLYKEKLFLVPKSDPSTLLWSKSFYPEDWTDLNNYMHVNKGDGDKITALRTFLDELVIFKRHSIHVLHGSNLDTFRMVNTETKIGATGPLAVTRFQNSLFFVNNDGIYTWNGMSAVNISRERIPEFWEQINQEHLDKAVATTRNGMVWFSLPEGTSSYNNIILVYVPIGEGGKWWIYRGINASCFTEFNTGNEILLYSGDSYEGYVNQQDVGTDDFGNSIDAHWVGKTFDCGLPDRKKKFKKAFIRDYPGSGGNVNLQVALNYGTYTDLVFECKDDLVRRYRFPIGTYARYLTPKISHTTKENIEVRGINFLFKPKSKPR